jgi:hypothetical protein
MRMRFSGWVLMTLAVSSASLAGAAATLGFGFGGSGALAFFPDLGGVNAYVSENGMDPLGSFLIGGGGGGRGGVIGGMALGGMGFGMVATTPEEADRVAELVVGAGGFDIGYAVGGDERSVLTLGAVLGGGATVLTLVYPAVEPLVGPRGITPMPTEERTIGRAYGFVLPYVSMEAQILSFLGLEVRIGYLLPVVGVDFGYVVGVPAPSLDLSGPFVGISLVFGGIGGGGEERDAARTATSSGSIDVGSATKLSIEGGMGAIQIASAPVEVSQTSSHRTIEWEAVRRASRPQGLADLHVEVAPTATGISMHTVGKGGSVDYAILVPTGMSLEIVGGSGRIELAPYVGTEVSISLGAGMVVLTGTQATTLSVSAGAGALALTYPQVSLLSAHIGMGEIALTLPSDASVTIAASVGMGELTIGGFPETTGSPRGVISRTLDAVLGAGVAQITLSVGMGKIDITSPTPAPTPTP